MSTSPQIQFNRVYRLKVSLERFVCALTIGLCVLACALPVFADDDSNTTGGWQEFKSDKYKFRALFPGAPTEGRNPGNNLPQFEYKGSTYAYDIMVQGQSNSPFFDSSDMAKLWKGFLSTASGVTNVSDISGDDWIGKSFNMVQNGTSCTVHLVAVKGGYLYLLSAVGETPAQDRDKFFNSFKGHNTNAFMVGCVIILACLGVGFLFLVGIGVGVFFLIKHNNKKKLQ